MVHVEALRGHPLTNLLDVVVEEAHDIEGYERHGGVTLPKHHGARPDVVVDAVGRSSVLESREPCRLKLAIGLALVGAGVALVPFAELIAAAVEEGLRGLVPLGVALALVGLNPGLVVGTDAVSTAVEPLLEAGRRDGHGSRARLQGALARDTARVTGAHQIGSPAAIGSARRVYVSLVSAGAAAPANECGDESQSRHVVLLREGH